MAKSEGEIWAAEHVMSSPEETVSSNRPQISRDYFRTIVNGLKAEMMVIDRDYRLIDANAAFLRRVGSTWGEVAGRPCYEVTFQRDHPCEEAESHCPMQGIWESRDPVHMFHVHHNQETNQLSHFEIFALPVHDARGQVVQAIAICDDVTAERRLEAKLAAICSLGRELVFSRQEKLMAQAIVNAAERVLEFQLCQLWLIDENGENLVCWAHTPLKEPPAVSRLPLDGPQGVTVAVACSGEAIYLPDVSRHPRYVKGEPKPRSELCVPLKTKERVIGVLNAESERLDAFDRDDHHLLGALADQAALAIENARLFEVARRQREELRNLAVRLAETEETERRRLARELHDRVGQNLAALSIDLGYVRTHMTGEATALLRSRLEDALALVGQTGLCLRNVMADLRPPVLDNHGVAAALRWYGAQVASRTGLTVIVYGEEPAPRLPTPIETALFRIAQEALANAVKHAQASRVTMTMEMNDDGTMRLAIADDGVGFDAAHLAVPEEHRGWGLLSMAERARAVGARCHVESLPGHGTRVVVEVPR